VSISVLRSYAVSTPTMPVTIHDTNAERITVLMFTEGISVLMVIEGQFAV
jgi:hypothetical protein